MDTLSLLRQRYAQYDGEAAAAVASAGRFGGLFGMGPDPRTDPCHEKFYDDIGLLTEDFLAAKPDPDEAAAVVRFLLEAPEVRRESPAYWFCYAALGHARPIIPLLCQTQRSELAAWFRRTYPRLRRAPVQQEVYRLLCGKGPCR